MQDQTGKTQGFTIVELIIIIGIMVLFSGIAIPYYNTNTKEKNLDQESKRVVDLLELAKTKAVSAEKTDQCTGEVRGYEVYKLSSSQLQIKIVCSLYSAPGYDRIVTTNVLGSDNVSISSLKLITADRALDYIVFNRLAAGVNVPKPGNPDEILSGDTVVLTIKSTNLSTNNCVPITISPAGLIEEGAKINC